MPPKDNQAANGLIEGIARGASQACVYVLEFQKTHLQVHGRIPTYTPAEMFHHISKGIVSSTLTSGIVYGTYFSVYNQITDKVAAGLAATFTTSLIKIPISNSMRVLQSGNHPHVLSAGRSIVRAQGVRGIYSGYGLSIVDDYLDMETRMRIYGFLRGLVPEKEMNHNLGLVMGAIAGSVAAAVTTPFDTIKCNMAIASTGKNRVCMIKTVRNMYMDKGILVFMRGVGYRASSSAIRTALFYLFYEMMLSHNKKND